MPIKSHSNNGFPFGLISVFCCCLSLQRDMGCCHHSDGWNWSFSDCRFHSDRDKWRTAENFRLRGQREEPLAYCLQHNTEAAGLLTKDTAWWQCRRCACVVFMSFICGVVLFNFVISHLLLQETSARAGKTPTAVATTFLIPRRTGRIAGLTAWREGLISLS